MSEWLNALPWALVAVAVIVTAARIEWRKHNAHDGSKPDDRK